MYVNHVQDTKSLVIFLSWSMGLFVLRWGVCGGMNRGGYSSTQGSKISKPEGCREDGEGGCSGRVSGLVGVGFCSSSSTRIPWKDHRVGWFVTALSSPFWLVTASEQMLELQQGVRMIPAPHSHTAGQSHSTSNSHTQPAVAEAHRLTTHTLFARVTLKDRRTLNTVHFCLLTSKMNINASPQNYVCSWNVLWVLTDRVWIHFKVLLENLTYCHGVMTLDYTPNIEALLLININVHFMYNTFYMNFFMHILVVLFAAGKTDSAPDVTAGIIRIRFHLIWSNLTQYFIKSDALPFGLNRKTIQYVTHMLLWITRHKFL